jgi:hypothetical protein
MSTYHYVPQHKRLAADRFRRIWATVTEIANRPGQSRLELSRTFHLSERQTQADLNIIRTDLRLPLVRRGGYRFIDEGGAGRSPDMREVQQLVMLLARARRDRSMPTPVLESLAEKVPGMLPPHLRPLASQMVRAVMARDTQLGQVLVALGDALLSGAWVTLAYDQNAYAQFPSDWPDPVVRPDILLPYLDGWYVLGESKRLGTHRMYRLDAVQAVTTAGLR